MYMRLEFQFFSIDFVLPRCSLQNMDKVVYFFLGK